MVHYCLAGTFFLEACGKVVSRAGDEEYIPHVETKNFSARQYRILFACGQKMLKTVFRLHGNESVSGRSQTKCFYPTQCRKERKFQTFDVSVV